MTAGVCCECAAECAVFDLHYVIGLYKGALIALAVCFHFAVDAVHDLDPESGRRVIRHLGKRFVAVVAKPYSCDIIRSQTDEITVAVIIRGTGFTADFNILVERTVGAEGRVTGAGG